MIRRIILAYWILTPCLVVGQSTTYGPVGGTVILKADVKDIPDEILWKHKGNKVVEFNGNEELVVGSFLNRITLDWVSADLTITNLRYEDSGEYVLETYKESQLTKSVNDLEVIDKVAKPTISCEKNADSSTNTSEIQATLTCSSEPGRFQSLIKFQWSSHKEPGPHLTISLGGELDDKVYNCTASNPVSEESTTFSAKDCHGEPISDSDSSIGIAIGVAVVLAFVIILALLFCKLKHKACFAKGNDEERASYESEGSENQRGQTPSRAPTFVSTQPLQPYAKNNKRSKNDEEAESLLRTPLRESSDDVGEEFATQHEEAASSDEDNSDEDTVAVRERVEHFEKNVAEEKQKDLTLGPEKSHPDPARNNKDVTQFRETTETQQTISEWNPADPEKMNDVLPGALNNDTEYTQSTLQSSTASEQPGLETM